jgi:hypothetical protein
MSLRLLQAEAPNSYTRVSLEWHKRLQSLAQKPAQHHQLQFPLRFLNKPLRPEWEKLLWGASQPRLQRRRGQEVHCRSRPEMQWHA